MRLVFFSSDRLEVERVSLALNVAKIPCEIRKGAMVRGKYSPLPETEIWIKRNADLSRAFLVCVEENLGFARRETGSADNDVYYDAVAA